MADNFYAKYSANEPATVVTSVNGLNGAVTLAAGSGITITPAANTLTIAASGGSGANTTLSNLTSPTAINQNLLPSADDTRILGTAVTNRFKEGYFSSIVGVGRYPFGGATPGAAIVNGAAPGLSVYNGGSDAYNVVADAGSGVSIQNPGAGVSLFNVQNHQFIFKDSTTGDTYFQGNSTTGLLAAVDFRFDTSMIGNTLILGNGVQLKGRNNADTDDLPLVAINSGDSAVMYDGALPPNVSINATNRVLLASDGSTAVDYGTRNLIDATGQNTVDFNGNALYSSSGSLSVNWETRVLKDAASANSIDWDARQLSNAAATPVLDWNTNFNILSSPNGGISYNVNIATSDEDSSGTVAIRTGIAAATTSGNLLGYTGDAAENSGTINFQTGISASASGGSGGLNLITGDATSGYSGAINISTGVVGNIAPGVAGSGDVDIFTGQDAGIASGNGSGTFNFGSGPVTDAASTARSGSFYLVSGDVSGSGNSGDFNFIAGAPNSGNRGGFIVDANYMKLPVLSADPTITGGAQEGMMYVNSTAHTLKVYLNGSWKTVTAV